MKGFSVETEYPIEQMHADFTARLQASSQSSSNVDHRLRDTTLNSEILQQQADVTAGEMASEMARRAELAKSNPERHAAEENARHVAEVVRKATEAGQKQRDAELSERFAAVAAANTNPDNLGMELIAAQRQYEAERTQEQVRLLMNSFAKQPVRPKWRNEAGGPEAVAPSEYTE